MNLETRVILNRFKPREYQIPLCDAILNKGYKRAIACWPRRAGKDIVGLNIALRECIKRPIVCFYVFPTYSQGRKIIWDSLDNNGYRIIDYYIPAELVESKNIQQMQIRLKNGSLIQIVGSDNIDNLVGTNCNFVIYSEYALQSPLAYQFIRPILAANDGKCIFLSTPRGKNHFWELFQIASHSDDWFSEILTLHDTNHISFEEVERDRVEGIMSDDMIEQEYFCSFDKGVEGSYYTKYLDRIRLNHQIGQVPWESGFKVNTAWDLGMRDSTAIIFFQTIGQTVRIIDCYENSKEGLEHYVKVLENKPYSYGKHIAPHDIKVRELGTGVSRLEKARQLGVNFIVAPDLSIIDGIEAVRTTLSRTYIDDTKALPLLRALENYRQEYDVKRKVYKEQPLHDNYSHMADAMRYLAISLPKTRDGLTASEVEKNYQQSRLGPDAHMPRFFRDDDNY